MDIIRRNPEDLAVDAELREKEKNNKSNNGSVNIAAGYAATESARASTQKAVQKFAKPDSYTGNRNLFDSGKMKKEVKEQLFNANGVKKIVKDGVEVAVVPDPYTGEFLTLTKKEAKLLYGDDWAGHLAEADHIKPLEKIFDETKDNPWLSTEDVKSIGSDSKNMRVISSKTNNAKRSRTNEQLVKAKEYLESKGIVFSKEGQKEALRDGRRAEFFTKSKEIGVSARNVVQTGHEAGIAGAKSAGITAGAMSGIMNTIAVMKGEKEADEAIADTLKDGGQAVVSGYVMSGGLTVVSNSLSGSASRFLRFLSESNVPGKIITAVTTVGDTLRRYGDGEITTQQCMIELGEKGLNLATAGYSALIGQTLIPIPVVGGVLGALVGSALTSGLYHSLIGELQTKELEHQERLRIIMECRQAAEQARAFRAELEVYLENYFKEYRDCFDEALSVMQFAFYAGDADGVIAGANQITRKLGGQVHYETVDQFKSFLNDKSLDIL